jgi:enoyl-CoA hydratase/carnithine racemase
VTEVAAERLVVIERYGARGELVLNRPHRRNALIRPLVEELHAGVDELNADDEVRVILIRGEGGTFSAGMDLKARQEEPELMEGMQDAWAAFHAAVFDCPKPVVGALEGVAIAGGSGLALACDFLIAGEGARLHVSEVRMGMAAPMNVAWLMLKFGYGRTLELVAGGQPLSGRELAERGIAVRAVADDRVVEEARAYADALAENDPAAVARTKSMLRSMAGIGDFRTHLRALQQAAARSAE